MSETELDGAGSPSSREIDRRAAMPESAEMYLETMLVLENEGRRVRAVDIATRMGFSRPTVSEQLKKLASGGYLVVGGDHEIRFTEKGRRTAEHTYERHVLLSKLFESVGVTPTTAVADACRVEHYISDETFDCLRRHYLEHAEASNGQSTGA